MGSRIHGLVARFNVVYCCVLPIWRNKDIHKLPTKMVCPTNFIVLISHCDSEMTYTVSSGTLNSTIPILWLFAHASGIAVIKCSVCSTFPVITMSDQTNRISYSQVGLFCQVASCTLSGLFVYCTDWRAILNIGSGVSEPQGTENDPPTLTWRIAVCTFPAVPRSTQPSTLRWMVNEYQLSGWVIIINGSGGCRW